jgi:rRNA maturation protein Nop10
MMERTEVMMFLLRSRYTMSHPCPCCRADIRGAALDGVDTCPTCGGVIDAMESVRASVIVVVLATMSLGAGGVAAGWFMGGWIGMWIALTLVVMLLLTVNLTGWFAKRWPPVAITADRQAAFLLHAIDLTLPSEKRAALRSKIMASRRALMA